MLIITFRKGITTQKIRLVGQASVLIIKFRKGITTPNQELELVYQVLIIKFRKGKSFKNYLQISKTFSTFVTWQKK